VSTELCELNLPDGGFVLGSGDVLSELTVAFERYGNLNSRRDNVVFICHALTGDAHVAGFHSEDPSSRGWWDSMVGPGKGIDTDRYHVVCANVLGGCKGTTGPASVNPATGKPYGSVFPHITVRDIVNVHMLLLRQLGVERVLAVVGASFGGMQAFEMALRYPDMIESSICIASAASLSTQALAFDAVARAAITSDPNWQGGDYYESGRFPADGLALARKIGHITYLSADIMTAKFGREKRRRELDRNAEDALVSDFEVGRYLDYQGHKFVGRFDANSYMCITKALDEYDLAAGHDSLEAAFERLSSKVLVVALTSDWLFPPEQSRQIANALARTGKKVSYSVLSAPHGHDGFLVDVKHLAEIIRAFLPESEPGFSSRADGGPQVEVVKDSRDVEYERLLNMVNPGSSVLDLGCGDGRLLSYLRSRRGVRGMGVDIRIENIIEVLSKGHDVFQNDVDGGLGMIPDDMYDYAILSETLQVVKKPRLVLREMLRVAHEGIVTFPNFGKWSHRMHLCLTGRMPKGKVIPYEWYDTPNIHPFTVSDFVDLCAAENVQIEEMVCIAAGGFDRFLNRCGLCNAGSSRVLVRVTTAERSSGVKRSCVCAS
jgi:homoserine O-acetyltransferase